MQNSRRHVISCLGVYCLLFELRFDVGSGNLKTSTSPPRGNQVDGLPRAASSGLEGAAEIRGSDAVFR